MFEQKATKQEFNELKAEVEELKNKLKSSTTIYINTRKDMRYFSNRGIFYSDFIFEEISLKELVEKHIMGKLNLSIEYEPGTDGKVVLKENKTA